MKSSRSLRRRQAKKRPEIAVATPEEVADFHWRPNEAREERDGYVVFLIDVSGSMSTFAGARTRWVIAREAVEVNHKDFDRPILVAFGTFAEVIPSIRALPRPYGGTDMAGALRHCLGYAPLSTTLLISDGQPNNPAETLEVARQLPGVLHAIHCGADDDEGIEFLSKLVQEQGGPGRARHVDLRVGRNPSLVEQMREMLNLPALPAPKRPGWMQRIRARLSGEGE